MDSTDRGPKGLFRTQRKHPVHLRGYESGKRALLRCVQAHLGLRRTALRWLWWLFLIARSWQNFGMYRLRPAAEWLPPFSTPPTRPAE